MQQGKKYDIIIIMGDINAKIGKEKHLMNIAEKYTIHNVGRSVSPFHRPQRPFE
jgi:hypothetical protein